jgi:hypothetical protein
MPLSSVFMPAMQPLMPSTTGAALLDFAQSLADPGQALLTWIPDTHPCGGSGSTAGARSAAGQPWPGITCDEPLGSVMALDLSGRGLSGLLGPSLAALGTLRLM